MKIFINSSPVETSAKTISYENLCQYAGYSPSHNPSVVFSRGRNLEQGYLLHGNSITLSEGMNISIMITGNA